jgi:phosphoesterase RecJ-like protein
LTGLEQVAAELSEGRKLAVFHPNADCDAVGSALALLRNFPGIDISGAGGISRLGKRLLELVGEKVLETPDYLAYDKFVVLDTSNLPSLGIPDEVLASKKKIVIDHHLKNENVNGVDLYYCDDSKPSCAEIIWELLSAVKGAGGQAGGAGIDKETATALSAGILTDTAHLRFGKTSTVKALS